MSAVVRVDPASLRFYASRARMVADDVAVTEPQVPSSVGQQSTAAVALLHATVAQHGRTLAELAHGLADSSEWAAASYQATDDGNASLLRSVL